MYNNTDYVNVTAGFTRIGIDLSLSCESHINDKITEGV